jgi:hypothetical protein
LRIWDVIKRNKYKRSGRPYALSCLSDIPVKKASFLHSKGINNGIATVPTEEKEQQPDYLPIAF